MNAADKVSIIIPCWNAERWIAETLESVLAQEGVPLDILVIDDGSTDGSLDVVRSFGERVRWLSGPNQGVSGARNWGARESDGAWIVFLDADDLLIAGTLAQRVALATRTAADVVICDWAERVEDKGVTTDSEPQVLDMKTIEADAELAFAIDNWAPPAALLFSRSIVDRIGGFRVDLPVIADARYLFDAAVHGGRFERSPHVGARYRVHPDSFSRANPSRFYRDILLNGKQIEAVWRAKTGLDAERRQVLEDTYNHAAHGFFRASDTTFSEVTALIRAKGWKVAFRNRAAAAFLWLFGPAGGARMANTWTRSRKQAERLTRMATFR